MDKPAAGKRIVVVGAGPGGLTAAMLLARRGFRVSVFEKQAVVGGRNCEMRLGPYSFDVGPTFLMMKFLLDQLFEEIGRKVDDYLDFVKLEPMYALDFGEQLFRASSDREKLAAEVERIFPGASRQLDAFFTRERNRFEKMYPCLQKDYSTLGSMLAPMLLRALPSLDIGKSMYDILARYFEEDRLRISFTFQSKYLGMSPWSCPAAFMIIPYLEYGYGVYHVQGGLCRISAAMSKVIEEEGGEIRLQTPVRRLVVEGSRTTGVELEDGTRESADAVVLNADFGHAMSTLVEPGVLRRWTEPKLRKRAFSCSAFMLYLGLNKLYPMEHHTIVFSRDYRKYIEAITDMKPVTSDLSFYIRNSSVTDPGVAPPGHSAVYVLVPVANNNSGIDWNAEAGPFREMLLEEIAQRTPMQDLREHIVEEKVITPADWERRGIFIGATFNLAHTLGQMLYFRPRNAFEEIDRCYLVGGGTHPGSGLPTIYESGRISANLICRRFGVAYPPAPPPPPGER